MTVCSARCKAGSIDQATGGALRAAFSEAYKQTVAPLDAIADISIIEELQQDSVKLVFAEGRDGDNAQLTWYLGGRSASLIRTAADAAVMGVVVLEERPFTVTRADGLPVWIYQFRVSPNPTIPGATPDETADVAKRFADAVTAIWQGWVEIDRFNELVLRAGLTWQQVVILRAYAKYLRQAGFPYSQAHIETVINDNAGTARSLVELFEAVFDPRDQAVGWREDRRRSGGGRRGGGGHRCAWSAWTPTGCCARSRR